MKQLFFAIPALTASLGVTLNPAQTDDLKELLEEACKLDDSPLACRIAIQLHSEADWEDVRVLLEDEETEESFERLHVNFPIKNCIGQMELYTWKNDDNHFCIGLGTSDCSDFALERLKQGTVRELAIRFFTQIKAAFEAQG